MVAIHQCPRTRVNSPDVSLCTSPTKGLDGPPLAQMLGTDKVMIWPPPGRRLRIRSAVHAVASVACSPAAPVQAAQDVPRPWSRWRGTRAGTIRPGAQPSDRAGRRSRRHTVARRHPGITAIGLCSARRSAIRGRRGSRCWPGPRPRKGLPGSAKARTEVRAAVRSRAPRATCTTRPIPSPPRRPDRCPGSSPRAANARRRALADDRAGRCRREYGAVTYRHRHARRARRVHDRLCECQCSKKRK